MDNLTNLQDQCFRCLENLYSLVANYGIRLHKQVDLVFQPGILSFYNRKIKTIIISNIVLEKKSKFETLVIKQLFGIENSEEFTYLMNQFLPFLIAHEFMHYLRDCYDKLSSDLWLEEQIANYFAMTYYKSIIDIEKQKKTQSFIYSKIDSLSELSVEKSFGFDSYENLVVSWKIQGMISEKVYHKLINIPANQLANYIEKELSDRKDLLQSLNRRSEFISVINKDYNFNFGDYAYIQLCWFYISLLDERHYSLEHILNKYILKEIVFFC